MKLFLSALFFFCIASVTLKGQSSPVKYTWEARAIGGSEYEITFKAKIKEGWYTYSQYLESDDGPIPTTIFFESDNEKKVGKPTEKTSKPEYKLSGFDKMFDMNITKYKKNLVIRQKIEVTDATKAVSGYLEYMTCDDTKCMPPTAVEFSFVPSELESSASNDNPETPEDNPTEDNETDDKDTESAPEKPVNWTINFNKVSDNEVDLVATATIAEGWYVYSQTLESDDGPIPTSINYEDSTNIEWGNNAESASVPENKLKMMDEVFEMELTKFKHDFTITQRLKIKDLGKPVTGFLEYMTCDATKCMPPTAVDFTFSWDGKITNSSQQGTVVDGKFDPKRPELIRTNKSPLGKCEDDNGQEINNNDNIAGMSLLTIFILGFGGGLLALLTPCVFPMIPMTVSLFSKGKDKSQKEGIKKRCRFRFVHYHYLCISGPVHYFDIWCRCS